MNNQKGRLTSGAFAAFCGSTKETLRHYKDIGLLSPAYRGSNNYCYYGIEQFYDFYAISIFRQTGTPLEEIRRCLKEQNAAETLKRLQKQQKQLEAQRQSLEQMEFVLSGMIQNLELGTAPDMTVCSVWFRKEHLLAIPIQELKHSIPVSSGEDACLIAVLERCRTLCLQYKVQTDFQLGAIHLPGEKADQTTISHLYIRIREKTDSPYYMEKPAGNYLYLCCHGHWDISEGYAALSSYIQERKLKTEGNFYACDLAGFILNGVEKNATSLISIRLPA